MPKNPRSIQKFLMANGFGSLTLEVVVCYNQSGTATVTLPLLVANSKMKIRRATWVAQNATDGTKTAQLKNNTKAGTPFFTTPATTVSGLAALAAADLLVTTVESDKVINKSDVLVVVYTVSVAGAVQPGEVRVTLEFQLLG